MMIQAPAVTWSITPWEIITGVGLLISTVLNSRFLASNSQIKLDVKSENEKLRNDITDKLTKLEDRLQSRFVPGDLANEQRSALLLRVEKLENELNKNRDRIHEMANQLQTLMLGPVTQLQTALTDKARRMAVYEERSRSVDDRLRDIDEELEELRNLCKSLSKS